jgi:clan AA aspartic protease (TIGR02281 family)
LRSFAAACSVLSTIVIFATPALRAGAEIYRWVDSAGQLHFSQSLEQVPKDKRRGAVEAATQGADGEPDPLQRFDLKESAPARIAPRAYGSQRSIRIPFERQGTLMKVVARLNDRVDVPFYVDTGASGISLPAAYVKKLGIRVDKNTPRVQIRTANGTISEPVVEIGSVELGGARVEGLHATVSSGMRTGLLGGSFFNQFVYGVDAAQGVITLERNEGLRGGLREEEWRARFRRVRTPLSELEAYLASKQITRSGREAELLEHRGRLREALRDLEVEARQAGVPATWRN